MSRKPLVYLPEVTSDAEMRTLPLPDFRAAAAEPMISAAAPSPVGQQCQSVNGSATSRAFITSSSVTRLRICALGLSAP